MILTKEIITSLILKPAPQFSKRDAFGGLDTLEQTSALIGLIYHDYASGENYENRSRILQSIHLKLQPVLYGGYEPCFDNGHNWGYPLLCQSFALIKNKKSLWNIFSIDEQERITVLMEMFKHMWTLGCNKYNNFLTGIGLNGNYRRNGAPNYMLSNEALMLYCVHFFGNLTETAKACAHSYDQVIAQLKKYNFKNALEIWTTPGFQLPDGTQAPGAREIFGSTTLRRSTPGYRVNAYRKDSFNNIVRAGYGKGCTMPFYYRDRDFEHADFETYPHEIYEHILNKTFSGGLCVDNIQIDAELDYTTKIADDTSSPYAGLDGMMHEFNNWDNFGSRSSLFHCEIDFYEVCALIYTLRLLGVNVLADSVTKGRVLVGMGDCLYKMQHGYLGYSMGHPETDNMRIKSLTELIFIWEELEKILVKEIN